MCVAPNFESIILNDVPFAQQYQLSNQDYVLFGDLRCQFKLLNTFQPLSSPLATRTTAPLPATPVLVPQVGVEIVTDYPDQLRRSTATQLNSVNAIGHFVRLVQTEPSHFCPNDAARSFACA